MARRVWWQVPSFHDADQEHERKVSWLELFFDLVFVVAISQLAHHLVDAHSLRDVGEYVLLFVPVWWAWLSSTVYTDRFETEGLEQRLFFFLKMIALVGLAVGAHKGLEEGAKGFAVSYAAYRLLVVFLWLRASVHVPAFRPVGVRYAIGFLTSVVLFLGSLFVDHHAAIWMWVVALFIDLITPWFTLSIQARLPRLGGGKLVERLGLFVLIVLGESVVGVVNGLVEIPDHDLTIFTNSILGLGVGFLGWWVYFDFIARRHPRKGVFNIISWNYLHLPLAMALTAIGPGVLGAITGHGAGWLLPGAAAIALVVMAALETRLAPRDPEPTHPFVSPLLKLIAGAVLLVYALALAHEHSGMPELVAVLVAYGVQAGYGIWVWFGQDLPEIAVE